MGDKGPQEQRSRLDTFGGTPLRPWIPALEGFAEAPRAKLAGEQMVTGQGTSTVQLTQQEFLLFRGIDDAPKAAQFASGAKGTPGYGLLGLGKAVTDLGEDRGKWPLWAKTLTLKADDDPSEYYWREPVEDWVRQSGLMSAAIGLLGLLKEPRRRAPFGSTLSKMRPTLRSPSIDHGVAEQHAVAMNSSSWQTAAVLDGMARAGLLFDGIEARKGVMHASFVATPFRTKESAVPPIFRIAVSAEGVSQSLVGLLKPWLQRVRASMLVSDDGSPAASFTLPSDLIGTMWLQLGNAVLSVFTPSTCSWKGCPGPPERPGVYLWRWGRTPTGIKHTDAKYCHERCKHAASTHRSRQSPAHKREIADDGAHT